MTPVRGGGGMRIRGPARPIRFTPRPRATAPHVGPGIHPVGPARVGYRAGWGRRRSSCCCGCCCCVVIIVLILLIFVFKLITLPFLNG